MNITPLPPTDEEMSKPVMKQWMREVDAYLRSKEPVVDVVTPTPKPAPWSNQPKVETTAVGATRPFRDSPTLIQMFDGKGWQLMTKAHYDEHYSTEQSGILRPAPVADDMRDEGGQGDEGGEVGETASGDGSTSEEA